MKTIVQRDLLWWASLLGALLPFGLSAGQLANPTVTASATPFSASYTADNLFDTGLAEYASRSQGAVSAPFTTNPADGTWVELDFGQPVTFDQFVMVSRRNAVDVIGVSRLIASADPVFDETDTIFTFEPSGANGAGIIRNLSPVAARYVRWEALTRTGTGLNLGGSQMYFLNTTEGHTRLAAPSVINAFPAFNANYAAAFAANGDAGYDTGNEYASAGAGAAMFIDFDFGASVPISGFDYWNRWADRVTTFDLVFADTPDFGVPLAVLSFAAGPNGNQVTSGSFAPVSARYVRFQATGYENSPNTGAREIQFFTPAGQRPIITQSPQSAIRLVGDAVTFTVAASGENLVHQWWKETASLEWATNASLILTNLQLEDSGTYTVVVSNPFGSVTSAPAVLTVTNPPVDITSDLRLWFKFDETSSLVAIDESGTASDGTLQGFVGDDSQWVAGRIDNALSFSTAGGGTNQVVIVPDSSGLYDFGGTGEFTLAAWVKGAPGQVDSAGLIAKGSGGGDEQYALDIYNGTYRFFGRAEGGSPIFVAQGAVGPNGAWQHLAGVHSRMLNRLKLYINGVEVASSTPLTGNLLATLHDVSIGARQLSTNEYNLTFGGLMDDVRIYARALTPADVLEVYSQAPAAPEIGVEPQGFYLPVGAAWVFSVGVGGSTPLFYQWSKNGTPIPDATNDTYLVTNAQPSDTGDYAVVARNAYGTAPSASARLTAVPSLDLRAATVQASSEWPGSGYPPANAFDGLRLSTGPNNARWASASQGTPQWIYVDLGRDMLIQHVLLDWEYAAGRDMKLRVRTEAEGPSVNPDDWREVASVTGYLPIGNGVDGADMVFDFAGNQVALQGNISPSAIASIESGGLIARYLMVHALALTTPHQHCSLWEMQVNADLGPRLSIQRSGSSVVISWPTNSAAFELQETDRLPATTWTPVPGVANNSVTLNAAEGTNYFRLKQP